MLFSSNSSAWCADQVTKDDSSRISLPLATARLIGSVPAWWSSVSLARRRNNMHTHCSGGVGGLLQKRGGEGQREDSPPLANIKGSAGSSVALGWQQEAQEICFEEKCLSKSDLASKVAEQR